MAPNLLQDSLNALLNSQAIFTVFQPIVDLNRRSPLGYEALTRGEPGNLLQRPDMMFDTAFRYQRLSDLEQLCLSSALSSFEQQSSDALLFINICPESMTQQPELLNDTIQALQKSGLRPEQLVLEISERFPVKNTAELQQALTRYKEAGFAIAIDDLGSGYSGLKLWSDIHPDYVKIDRHFIHKVDQDPVKQAFVNSVVRLCDQLNCRVIAEGIETETELATLRSMGIHLAQGYLLGQPRPALAFSLPQACQQTAEITLQGGLERPIGDLCQPLMCITPDTRMSDADRLFNEIPSLASLPVVKDDVPVGLIRRHTLLEHFSRPYGRALYEKRPVGEFLQKDSVIVESQMSIGHVSKRITDSDGVDLMQPVIITQNGRYQGVVGTRTLLRHITDARYKVLLTFAVGNAQVTAGDVVRVMKVVRARQEVTQNTLAQHSGIGFLRHNHEIITTNMPDKVLIRGFLLQDIPQGFQYGVALAVTVQVVVGFEVIEVEVQQLEFFLFADQTFNVLIDQHVPWQQGQRVGVACGLDLGIGDVTQQGAGFHHALIAAVLGDDDGVHQIDAV